MTTPMTTPKTTPKTEPTATHGESVLTAGPGTIGRGLSRVWGVIGRHVPWVDKLALVVLGLLILLCIFGPTLTPHDPYDVIPADSLKPPGWQGHLLGTDDSGRDILSRLMVGARPTLVISFVIVVLGTFIGVLVAAIAALAPPWFDEALMRFCDIFLAVPPMVLALGVAAALGSSQVSLVIAMVIAMWPSPARLMRGILRESMTASHVEAARVMGLSRTRTLIQHVLPNSMDSIWVKAGMELSGTIVLVAGLAYIGLGAPPPSADWGSMVALGRPYSTSQWWVAMFPGLAITLAAVAFALLGDTIRVRLDPTIQERTS